MDDLNQKSAMQAYKFITDQGVVVPDTAAIKEQVEAEYKAALGEDLSLDASTPQGRLIEQETLARATTLQLIALMANMMNPNEAFGMGLDALAAFSNTTRNAAVRTRVLVQMSGTPNTLVPANTTQGKTQAGDVFYLENDIQLDRNGTAQAYFLAQETGPIPCEAGELTQIVSGPLGLETIVNGTNGEVGSDQESDASLRLKRLEQLPQGVALLEDYISSLSKVPNIRGYRALENYTNEAKEVQGVMVDAHSVYIIADGGEDQAVAEAIFKVKSGGCGYTGTTTVTVSDPTNNIEYDVSFNRPTIVNCQATIKVKITETSGTTSEITSAVKNAVLSWQNGEVAGVEGLNIGTSVSAFEMAAAVSDQLPGLFITDCQVGLKTGTVGYSVLPMQINQRAVILEDDITVVVQ